MYRPHPEDREALRNRANIRELDLMIAQSTRKTLELIIRAIEHNALPPMKLVALVQSLKRVPEDLEILAEERYQAYVRKRALQLMDHAHKEAMEYHDKDRELTADEALACVENGILETVVSA